jgi:uncharacterized phage protein gp47/JayE
MSFDATGYTPQTLAEIRTELETAFRKEFGPTLILTPDTIAGKLIGILAEREDTLQQVTLTIFDSFSPGTASDISLDRIAAITGVTRNPATRSTASLYLAGNAATVIPIGSLIGVDGSTNRFRTTAPITLDDSDDFAVASGSPVSCTIVRSASVATVTALSHGMPNGAIVTISGADQPEYNITAVISNVSAGTFDYVVVGAPTTPATGTITFIDESMAQDPGGTVVTVRAVAHGLIATDIRILQGANEADYNRVVTVVAVLDANHFTYDGVNTFSATPATGTFEGKEANLVAAEAVSTGLIAGLSHTINTIINAISGWELVDNLLDATEGVGVETDAALRARRIAALQGLGNATLEAIRGDLLLVESVTQVVVFENDTDLTVGIRTPHSVEAVVTGGTDQAVIDALFDTKAAGIATVGNQSGTHTDSQGVLHTVDFSRPVEKDIWIEIILTTSSDYPSDGDTQVKNALKAEGDLLDISDDVIPIPQLIGALDDIPGIRNISIGVLAVDSGNPDPSPTPGTDDGPITIGDTEQSVFDTSRITVT